VHEGRHERRQSRREFKRRLFHRRGLYKCVLCRNLTTCDKGVVDRVTAVAVCGRCSAALEGSEPIAEFLESVGGI
jgi:transcription elongation factor Elf1